MSNKENNLIPKEPNQPTKHAPKEAQRYTGTNKNVPETLNKTETGIRPSRGKKQRRQFKLAQTEDKTVCSKVETKTQVTFDLEIQKSLSINAKIVYIATLSFSL